MRKKSDETLDTD